MNIAHSAGLECTERKIDMFIYNDLKAAGICVHCRRNPAVAGRAICRDCADRTEKIRRLRNIVRPIRYKGSYSISDIVHNAEVEGLSYGQYVMKYGL